jgi:hypothetical protein
MDPLTNSIIGINQAATMSKIQFAVAKKVMDTEQGEGQAAIELLQAATQGSSQAGDALAAAATGLGGQLDITA